MRNIKRYNYYILLINIFFIFLTYLFSFHEKFYILFIDFWKTLFFGNRVKLFLITSFYLLIFFGIVKRNELIKIKLKFKIIIFILIYILFLIIVKFFLFFQNIKNIWNIQMEIRGGLIIILLLIWANIFIILPRILIKYREDQNILMAGFKGAVFNCIALIICGYLGGTIIYIVEYLFKPIIKEYLFQKKYLVKSIFTVIYNTLITSMMSGILGIISVFYYLYIIIIWGFVIYFFICYVEKTD